MSDHHHEHAAAGEDTGATGETAPRPRKQEQEEATTDVTEVAPGIVRTQLPVNLPGLGHVNCYLMEDERGIAVVDPGLPGDDSWNALNDRLGRAGYAVGDIHTVVITHSHFDHFGGATRIHDITGADIIQEDPETGRRQFEFLPGPIFANLVLADEINRCPPKTQASLLEAMQERRVTVRGRGYELPDPFVVLATQNPIEQEGTYPLPEAQLDRFFFLVRLGYPTRDEEIEVLRRTTATVTSDLKRVLSAREVVQLQDLVRTVPAPEPVLAYAADLARASRPADGHPEARRWLSWGAGPRGAQVLVLAAKARALLSGRFHASCDDVAAIVLPALRHRVVPSFAAQAEGLDADAVLGRIVPEVKRP